jgi:octaprenyl-diphosphate synthase
LKVFAMGVSHTVNKNNRHSSNINQLIALTAADMERVNTLILSKAESAVDLIPQISSHLITSGGKRLRPMLTIASAQMLGYSGEGHIKLATSVEFMHTATLLHDDVVDESHMRRGKSTARMIWGNQASVLVGDFLLGQAFRMMVDVQSLQALSVLSDAACTIAEGEVMQLQCAQNLETTQDDYLAVIRAKTAALFSAAAEMGPIIAHSGDHVRSVLRNYGLNLGLAFQLIDDALDYSGSSDELGKNIGDDFREGKVTLPVIIAYKMGSESEREFWRTSIQEEQNSDADLAVALDYLIKHDALNQTISMARDFGNLARDALEALPDSEHKTALLNVIDFCISRIN